MPFTSIYKKLFTKSDKTPIQGCQLKDLSECKRKKEGEKKRWGRDRKG